MTLQPPTTRRLGVRRPRADRASRAFDGVRGKACSVAHRGRVLAGSACDAVPGDRGARASGDAHRRAGGRRPAAARLLADRRGAIGAPGVGLRADERGNDDPRSRPASPSVRRARRPGRDRRARSRADPRSTRHGSRRSTRRRRGSPTIPSAQPRLGPLRLGRGVFDRRLELLALGGRGARLARFVGSVGRSGR